MSGSGAGICGGDMARTRRLIRVGLPQVRFTLCGVAVMTSAHPCNGLPPVKRIPRPVIMGMSVSGLPAQYRHPERDWIELEYVFQPSTNKNNPVALTRLLVWYCVIRLLLYDITDIKSILRRIKTEAYYSRIMKQRMEKSSKDTFFSVAQDLMTVLHSSSRLRLSPRRTSGSSSSFARIMRMISLIWT